MANDGHWQPIFQRPINRRTLTDLSLTDIVCLKRFFRVAVHQSPSWFDERFLQPRAECKGRMWRQPRLQAVYCLYNGRPTHTIVHRNYLALRSQMMKEKALRCEKDESFLALIIAAQVFQKFPEDPRKIHQRITVKSMCTSVCWCCFENWLEENAYIIIKLFSYLTCTCCSTRIRTWFLCVSVYSPYRTVHVRILYSFSELILKSQSMFNVHSK